MAIECSEGLWDGGLSNPVFVAEVYEADAGAGRGPISNVTTHGKYTHLENDITTN